MYRGFTEPSSRGRGTFAAHRGGAGLRAAYAVGARPGTVRRDLREQGGQLVGEGHQSVAVAVRITGPVLHGQPQLLRDDDHLEGGARRIAVGPRDVDRVVLLAGLSSARRTRAG